MHEMNDRDTERKEELIVDRCTVTMRRQLPGFLLCSLNAELCIALLCPDKTHEKDLKRRMP